MLRSNVHISDMRSTEHDIQSSTRVLVIGAGYAGLLFTMRLAGKVARQNVHISLVNETDTFTGWLGYQVREIFVRYLAAAPRLEQRWPGLFVWPGRGRYERALRRQQAKANQNAMQLIEYNEGT
jgi:hypothetical protein